MNDSTVDKEFNLTHSKTFCMAPWVHTHIWPNGNVFPCCMYENDSPITNYNKEKNLIGMWNTQNYKKLRLKMINNEEVKECRRCYTQDSFEKFSHRHMFNSTFKHLYNIVEGTRSDGHLEKLELAYLDIRFSNLCNLICRTCGPDLSSSWGSVRSAEFPTFNLPVFVQIESDSKSTKFWDDLSNHLSGLEHIYFAGGEPLLMKEHYDLLEFLVDNKKFNLSISYNTNFSTFKYKDKNVLDYWKLFSNVKILASLDGSHETGELIRKNLVWETVIKNRIEMKRECPNVEFILSPTVSVLNAHHILDFYEEWLSAGLVEKYRLNINVLQNPSYYRLQLLPISIKQNVVNQVDRLLAEAVTLGHPANPSFNDRYRYYFISELTQFRNVLLDNTIVDEEEIRLFNEETNKLDKDRNENTWELFPHLTELKRNI